MRLPHSMHLLGDCRPQHPLWQQQQQQRMLQMVPGTAQQRTESAAAQQQAGRISIQASPRLEHSSAALHELSAAQNSDTAQHMLEHAAAPQYNTLTQYISGLKPASGTSPARRYCAHEGDVRCTHKVGECTSGSEQQACHTIPWCCFICIGCPTLLCCEQQDHV